MKGTLILVSPGKGHLENKQLPIPGNIHRLFIVDGTPINPFTKSLILRPKDEDGITILLADHQCPWLIVNDVWSTSQRDQVLVVVAPNKDIFRIAEAIAPRECRLMLSTYHPAGDMLISLDEDGGFEIIAS